MTYRLFFVKVRLEIVVPKEREMKTLFWRIIIMAAFNVAGCIWFLLLFAPFARQIIPQDFHPLAWAAVATGFIMLGSSYFYRMDPPTSFLTSQVAMAFGWFGLIIAIAEHGCLASMLGFTGLALLLSVRYMGLFQEVDIFEKRRDRIPVVILQVGISLFCFAFLAAIYMPPK